MSHSGKGSLLERRRRVESVHNLVHNYTRIHIHTEGLHVHPIDCPCLEGKLITCPPWWPALHYVPIGPDSSNLSYSASHLWSVLPILVFFRWPYKLAMMMSRKRKRWIVTLRFPQNPIMWCILPVVPIQSLFTNFPHSTCSEQNSGVSDFLLAQFSFSTKGLSVSHISIYHCYCNSMGFTISCKSSVHLPY